MKSGRVEPPALARRAVELDENDSTCVSMRHGSMASFSGLPGNYARLAPSLVNTPEQVDRAVRAVREISG